MGHEFVTAQAARAAWRTQARHPALTIADLTALAAEVSGFSAVVLTGALRTAAVSEWRYALFDMIERYGHAVRPCDVASAFHRNFDTIKGGVAAARSSAVVIVKVERMRDLLRSRLGTLPDVVPALETSVAGPTIAEVMDATCAAAGVTLEDLRALHVHSAPETSAWRAACMAVCLMVCPNVLQRDLETPFARAQAAISHMLRHHRHNPSTEAKRVAIMALLATRRPQSAAAVAATLPLAAPVMAEVKRRGDVAGQRWRAALDGRRFEDMGADELARANKTLPPCAPFAKRRAWDGVRV